MKEEEYAPGENQIVPVEEVDSPGDFGMEAKADDQQNLSHDKSAKNKEVMERVMVSDYASKQALGDIEDPNKSQRRYVETQFIPVELAKNQIVKMETDMKKMHERHISLMKEVDTNYKLIEEETQLHFTEFLDKWKKLAKNKIDQYKAAFNTLKMEKEDIQNRLQAILTDLQEKNKKLVEDYERLLEKYHKDLDFEKKQNKERVELMESTYDDELSKLRQEKIELEGLLEAMKSQKDTYEQKTKEMRTRMKEKEVTKREQLEAILGNYATDCARLVMEGIVDEISSTESNMMNSQVDRTQKRQIDTLKANVQRLERERETLRDQIRRNNIMTPARGEELKVIKKASVKLVGDAPESIVGAGVIIADIDHRRYDELVIEKHRLTRQITQWKKNFETQEKRKCTKEDMEPIRDLFRDLKRVNQELFELRGQSKQEVSGVNDSIVSVDSEVGRCVSASPSSRGEGTFGGAVASSAEIEKLNSENRSLKEEIQKLRLAMTGKVGETEVIKQLKQEIESLKQEKESFRIKALEAGPATGKQSVREKDLNKDNEKLRKENTQLQERLFYFKARAQTMIGGVPAEDQKQQDAYKTEYDKMLAESQELQKTIQELEPLKGKIIDLEGKLQSKEKEYNVLREKYEVLGVERLTLGKELLKLKEIEAERAKVREEISTGSPIAGKDPALYEEIKVLSKENEMLKSTNQALGEELKNSQLNAAKVSAVNEDLLEKLTNLRRFESDSKELEQTQEQLAIAEREINQLRVQMAMGLPDAPEDRNQLIKSDYEKNNS
eukprot:TRINITY_DN2816_c0_g1_i9.p2 TRINITY_DN2816_c0_g1~~TRINITY_DN2816_c0_g1_i9.p2  ORF type:complete len:783 (+),score=195.24 TRINITY_DN2816_c0_g1_i9:185-2533(+)